jgi:glycosyltransferase involved in cell wall biosynthesis
MEKSVYQSGSSVVMPPDRTTLPAKIEPSLAPHVCIVGPSPPPSGGMANQCQQLVRLLELEGLKVTFVRTNSPYRPLWIGQIPMVRALFRLLPFFVHLWRAALKADVIHVFANSGWAWYLFCAPALIASQMRGTPAIVNYRGGNADPFFSAAPSFVLRTLASAFMRVTPSLFLKRVFSKHGLHAQVIPNIIDLTKFSFQPRRRFGDSPHIIVTRNLERIYDIPTAIQAFVLVKEKYSNAQMTIAGSGPELAQLQSLVISLQLSKSIQFSNRIDNSDIPALYARADCLINPSTVDNMPISILEAFASGVPVVSTDAGGIPDMLENGVSGFLVPVGDAKGIAREVLRVLEDGELSDRITRSAFAEAEKYAWPIVRTEWLKAYRSAARIKRQL